MSRTSPLRVLLAAAPEAPGSRAVLERARAARGGKRPLLVLLTGPGLAWADDPALEALASDEAVEVSLCSRSARERGLSADSLPSWVRWSSLVAWLRAADAPAALWAVFP